MKPVISVCIPVYGTEENLLSCLQSVAGQQGFNSGGLEIIVVNDASPTPSGKDCPASCSQIVSLFKNQCAWPVLYFQHEENLGLIEARRTAVEAASGDYVFCLDSDDNLPANALSALYSKAVEEDADIVQGQAQVILAKEGVELGEKVKKALLEQGEKKVKNVFIGRLEGAQILQNYLVEGGHSSFLWGKLIRRQLYLRALELIPEIYCTMAEDLLQYILITHQAKRYCGIPVIVYNYAINTGISSHTLITSLSRWEQVCSTASVFTVLFACLEELDPPFTAQQLDVIRQRCRFYVVNNLLQLRNSVVPELQEEAYQVLCDYWGEGLVKRAEQMLEQEKSNKKENKLS